MTTIEPGTPCGPFRLPASYNADPNVHRIESLKRRAGKPKKRDRKPYTKKGAKK